MHSKGKVAVVGGILEEHRGLTSRRPPGTKKKEATRAKQVRNIPLSPARSFEGLRRACAISNPIRRLLPEPVPRHPTPSRGTRASAIPLRERAQRDHAVLVLPPHYSPLLVSPPTMVLGQVLGSRHGGRDDSRRVPSVAESRSRRAGETSGQL